jgi:hypothetical protein
MGDWVGAIVREENWVRVIGVKCDGWVRADDLEERPPFQLHAHWNADNTIEYINAVEHE